MEYELQRGKRKEMRENLIFEDPINNEENNFINNNINNKRISNNSKINNVTYNKISQNLNHYSYNLKEKNK